jgi:O-antigen biosynthesis protein
LGPEREDELLAELKWLRHNQADLDARLQRVEDSAVFRILRAIGTFYQSNFQGLGTSSEEDYRSWATRHLSGGPAYDAAWPYQPTIGLVGQASAQTGQTYPRCSTDTSGADYIAELPAGVVLEPDVLARAVAAIQSCRPGLIYFDHQTIDESGDPIRPVFKPDWSPVLAEACEYAGPFTLRSAGPREGVLHIPHIGYSVRSPLRIRDSYPSPTQNPLVSLIVCTRNADLLARCLSSFRANTNYPEIEIVVVHHAGSDHDSRIVELAREANAQRILFRGAFNFSLMNNLGARAAKGTILLFLNDDVEPLDPNWLSRMVARLERPETGAVGAKLLYGNGSIQHAGLVTWEMGGAGHPGRYLSGSDYWPWLNVTREVTAVTGACLAIRRTDFESLNGFDTDFPVNYNDVDLCLRLQARGLSIIYEAGAVLQHDESQTRVSGVSFEERRRFFLRWHPRLEKTDPFYSPHLSQNDERPGLRD